MRKAIKIIISTIINTAVIAVAYKLGKNKGYTGGRNDGEMSGACGRCVYHKGDEEDCSDICDFEGICF
jgi:hypothetical protein